MKFALIPPSRETFGGVIVGRAAPETERLEATGAE